MKKNKHNTHKMSHLQRNSPSICLFAWHFSTTHQHSRFTFVIGVATRQLWGIGARDPLNFLTFLVHFYSCIKSHSDFVRLPFQTYLYYYHTQWTAQGSVFGAVCYFFCSWMKYLVNHRTDLHEIHNEDMFSPSLRQVWRSRSRGTKMSFWRSACSLCLVKHF